MLFVGIHMDFPLARSEKELNAMQSFAEQLVQSAGRRLRTPFTHVTRETHKGKDAKDILTDADTSTQTFIFSSIRKRFPSHGVYGEESATLDDAVSGATYTWVVDPLDATVNFAAGIPWWCVSLAVVDAQKNPVVGVVHAPLQNELFSARKGAGAFLNGKQVAGSRRPSLESIISIALSHHPSRAERAIALMRKASPLVRRIRCFGSSALDLAYTACGRIGGCVNYSSADWDVLAGILLVREAGGIVTGVNGEPRVSSSSGFIAAGSKALHAALLRECRHV